MRTLLTLFAALAIISPFTLAVLTTDDYALHVANSTGYNSTSWYDLSGNSRNATIEGNVTFAAYNGYGFNTTRLNSTDRVYRPFGGEWAIGGQNNSWSVYGWFLPASGATNRGTVWATSYNSYDNISSCQMNAGVTGTFACAFYNGSAYPTMGYKSCSISNDGVPHSFSYSWNRTTNTSTLYCDNIISTGTAGSVQTGTAQRTYFGQRTDVAQPLNGTLFWIGANQRVITTTEHSEVYNLGYNYLSSTPPVANNYVNITIGTTTVRNWPANGINLDTHEIAGFPFYMSNSSTQAINNTLIKEVINSVDPGGVRSIISLQNRCTSYTGNPINPCTFGTSNTSTYGNINLERSILGNQSAQGRKYYVNQDGMPKWLADNSSKCDYGWTNGVNWFNYTKCDPSNFTIYANAVAQYMEALGCTTTYAGYCVLEGWNEPYLNEFGNSAAGRGLFYYSNRTVDCAQRVTGQMALWNKTFPIYSARLGSAVEYLSPSFNYGYSSCGVTMGNTFMAQHSYGGNASPDFMNTHEYSSSNPPTLLSDIDDAQAAFTAGGWGSYWKVTEGNLNNGGAGNPAGALCNLSPEVCTSYLTKSMVYLISNTTIQGWTYYDLDTDESYSMYDYPDYLYTPNFLKPTGLSLNSTKYVNKYGGEVRSCTVTGDIDLTCSYVLLNESKAVLVISNHQNSTTLVQNVVITGGNVTGAVSNTNGTVYAASSSVVQNIILGKYGNDGYNITLEAADTSPPTLTNRSEWSNANTLQINVTCNEACNASINFGTVSTTLGNKSNITAFSTTIQSWNLTPLFSNTNYHYNITVCDAQTNCATYGIYSEFTKNSSDTNISFSSNTPAQSTTITENESQTFAYSINNPYSLSTTTTWRVNGVVQTDTDTNFVLIGNYSSAGVKTINVTIAAATANTITYEWTLTINDVTNISYGSTSPATPYTVAEPTSTNFIVSLTNPSASTVTYEWLVNGTNQTAYYNTTILPFTGSYSLDGNYNVTSKVYGPVNNLSFSWNYTITNSTAPLPATAVCESAQEGQAGLGFFTSFLTNIILAIILVSIITILYGISNGMGTMDMVPMIGRNLIIGAIGAIVLTFVVSLGQSILSGVGGC